MRVFRPSATRRQSAFARARCGVLAVALSAAACKSEGSDDPVGLLRSGVDAASGGAVVEIDLGKGLSEHAGQMSFFSASAPSLPDLVLTLERSRADRRTKGFYVSLGEGDLSWAQAEELGRSFAAVRAEKTVVCHAHGYSNVTLFFAARACDRVWLSPAGEVGTVGIAAQMLYLKRLLDRFEIKADFLHMGRYKSAAEALTEDGPSEAARESLESVLSSIRLTWLAGLDIGRVGKNVADSAERGPWSPDAALARGMVDAVGYESEARDDAKARAHADKLESAFGQGSRRDAADEVAQLIRMIAGASPSDERRDHVAVVTATGSITMTPSGAFGSGDGIAAEPLGKTLRRLRENDAVKAVVLRIDSPGGSALASDLLWHELMLLRAKKPLVASLAATAASGGYYMACAATRIIAERTSIIGSIGVVGGKIVIGDALDELGVSGVTFPASNEPGAAERATYLSPLSTWDEPTRESVRAQMAAIYELFLDRVAKGRGLAVEHVRQIAEGRIWSGAQGMDHKLIDEFGGLTEAIDIAKKQAGLPADAEVKIETGPEGILQFLQIEEDADDAAIRAALERVRALPASPIAGVAQAFRPYAQSLLPLLGKERVVAAVPFALGVK